MEIKEMFENIWKVKSMRPDIKEEDKKLYYDIFLDGYGCAILNIEEKNADQPKSKLETKIEGRTIKNAN